LDKTRTNVFALLVFIALFAWKDLEGVGTEVVTLQRCSRSIYARDKENMYLGLDEVGRNNLAPVAVEEGKSGAEGRGRDAPEDGLRDDTSPTRLGFVDS
jgi:hypothetical protein